MATSSDPSLYDVFLSFFGGHRNGFTGHLYSVLCKNGIKAWLDAENLRKGDPIGDTIIEAIENSKLSVVVLCENYGSSRWCLNELVKIIECHDNKGQHLMAVFYKVAPSDVRHQLNSYEAAMIQHETVLGKDLEKIKGWRSALSRVCDLSGLHLRDNEYEFVLINKIVKEIMAKLPPIISKNDLVVGNDSHFKRVNPLIDIENVRMLGIHGDGGIGKTTFAEELYHNIKHQFEVACFLENIGGELRRGIKSLEYLQKRVLFEGGHETKTMIGNTFQGSSEIKRWLMCKTVLLILDDVDSVTQLEALAGGRDWFGSGSRIVITTRDERLLDKHDVPITKYKMEGLNYDNSIELFCRHIGEEKSFLAKHMTNFEDLSRRLVSYSKGNPLVLKVIGSKLKGLSAEECEMELKRLLAE